MYLLITSSHFYNLSSHGIIVEAESMLLVNPTVPYT